MVKESLVPVLKEASRYVVISLRLNVVARRHLRAWYDARCVHHRYGDTLGEKRVLWHSEDETSCFGW
jgi:predicted HD phosphohydrolase